MAFKTRGFFQSRQLLALFLLYRENPPTGELCKYTVLFYMPKKVSKNQQRTLILIAGNKLANEQFRLKCYILDNIIYLLFIHLLIL